jgi:hypothetical protein
METAYRLCRSARNGFLPCWCARGSGTLTSNHRGIVGGRTTCALFWIQVWAKLVPGNSRQPLNVKNTLGWNTSARDLPFVNCLVSNTDQVGELLNAACRLDR